MKIKDLLASTEKQLKVAGIATSRLDALVLIEDFLAKDRSWIFANPDHKITKLNTEFIRNVDRRAAHDPLAYIRGKIEFFGRDFIINKHVLVPRPESETMIDLLKQIKSDVIVDVGTGSGALAVTAKLEMPTAQVLALDIDPQCIKAAKKNAKSHKVSIEFLESDLLSKMPAINTKLLTILANLPYVPKDYPINDAAKHEPSLAIFGGKDGLDLYRRLFQQLATGKYDSPTVICESLPLQHAKLTQIAESAGFEQTNQADLIQVFSKS